MCNVNCKLHVVKCQMSSQISRSLRSQKILWDMKQCIAMLNYNQSASIVYFLNWQQMLGVFWGVGKGKCCGVGRLRGVRGTAPISLGMCGILMWDGDTQNWRPNSCLACPHTFSHQHICTCWLLLTFHGYNIYIQNIDFTVTRFMGWAVMFEGKIGLSVFAMIFPHVTLPLAPFPSSDTNWWHLVPSASRLLSNRGAQLTHQLKNYILCFEDSPSPRRGCGYQLNRPRHPQAKSDRLPIATNE